MPARPHAVARLGYDARMTDPHASTVTAEVDVSASPTQVWDALTNPDKIRKYMFGSKVTSAWSPGSEITWEGEYDGRAYTDHGQILEVEPGRRLVLTHFSPLTGEPDVPENYHRVTYELSRRGDHTHLRLEQDNAGPAGARKESAATWDTILHGLKELVEAG